MIHIIDVDPKMISSPTFNQITTAINVSFNLNLPYFLRTDKKNISYLLLPLKAYYTIRTSENIHTVY